MPPVYINLSFWCLRGCFIKGRVSVIGEILLLKTGAFLYYLLRESVGKFDKGEVL